jgi:folate-binding protein YgfZ
MNATIAQQVLALRSTGGFSRSAELGLIEVSGADAGRLLQARTTNDVLGLTNGCGQVNCLLDRTAHLQAVFSIYRLEDRFWIVAENGQISTIIEQIELYHFREDAHLKDMSSEGSFWAIHGPEAASFLGHHLQAADIQAILQSDAARVTFDGRPLIQFRLSFTGEDCHLLWIPKELEPALCARLVELAEGDGFIELSLEALNVARIEAGIPKYGIDISSADLIADTGLEQTAVSYTKGCYVGQEVVARIKTYSAPRKGLVGLMFPEGSQESFPISTPCRVDDTVVGQLKSCAYSPTLDRTIALAFVAREFRTPGQKLLLDMDNNPCEGVVALLPFYTPPTREHRARQLYDQALSEFAQDRELEAIHLLRKALALDPVFADAYEALGVILSRNDQLDEAIELMQQLSQLDPDSVMAHTNLSVFYMQQGDKERAEEEKAQAMSIQMRKLAMEAAAQQQQQEDEQRKRQESVERMRMFREVLEIDSDDLLANYGLGSVHVDLGEFEQAVPYLEKAIKVKPTHTVAYLALGQAFEGLGNRQKAIETYKAGTGIAAKRGDMMPLKEMRSRLAQLESAVQHR